MASQYHYPGTELELFKQASRWKKYFAQQIQPYISGNVLEIGAGSGDTTAYLLNDKIRCWTCLEPDEKLFLELKNKLQNKNLPSNCILVHDTLATFAAATKYDTILYIDVLEHIEDDKFELERAVAHLKRGGHLIVLSPAFQKLFSPFDEAIGHCRRYTKKSLRKAAPAKHLKERKMIYIESAGALLLLLNKYLFKKKYPSPTDIWIWQNIFLPISKVFDKILFNRVGKSIIGVWQKVTE